MKSIKKISFFLSILLSSLFFSTTSFAVGNYNNSSGILTIPEVDVDGTVFFDNVALKLNFETGTFELVGFSPKPDSISATPIATQEEQNIRLDFLGCTRSGRNEVTCHVELTSLGGFDRRIAFNTTNSSLSSFLFDDLGNTYTAEEASVGNITATSFGEQVTLISGIPTLATFKYNNISPSTSNLSLFQPSFSTDGNNFTGDFRNIDF